MLGSALSVSHHKRQPLLEHWSICSSPPSCLQDARPADGPEWMSLRQLLPVAAALREQKIWSIDGPARRFDAEAWWYRLQFDAAPADPESISVLGFDGLATLAEVWLNGTPLLASDNMFQSHAFDVSRRLKPAGNELLIRFNSLDAQLATRRPRPRWRAPMIEHQQLRWIRTTLLGRTPGWSPPCAVVGPWKDVWLEQRTAIDLTSVRLDARVDGTSGILKCELEVEPLGGRAVESVELLLSGNTPALAMPLQTGSSTDRFSGELRVPDAALWWPHTHGNPSLYRARLSIRIKGLADEVTVDMGQVGFRTITLDTANDSFSLSVNGVRIFCRGACWTPLDPVTLRSSAADCRAAVAQACNAGMNMLRISGTMAYEEDHFYDACSEAGMLVWQDFMFANMDYPFDDEAFRSSVLTEVRQQLHRLQSKPCVALLCGNSEVSQQAAMWGAHRELWHSTFFNETLPAICASTAPSTPYWPSSACGGSFPHQASAGSTSYYGVGAYLRDIEDARRSELKFASECLAFANVPSTATLARMPGGLGSRVHHPAWKARTPRDLGAGWDFDDVRDHYLGRLLKIDPVKLRTSDHEQYLTLGRMVTGEVMTAAFAEWRRPRSACGGALVLFLRDLWAGAGWGLLDDTGAPKAAFHYLKRALQPVAVFFSDEGVNGLCVHVVNERSQSKTVCLELKAWRDGEVLLSTGKKILDLAPHSASTLPCLDFFEHFLDLGYAYRFGPMPCDVVTANLRDENGDSVSQVFHFPGGLNPLPKSDPGLSAKAILIDPETAELTLCTSRLAQAVHFELSGFRADDEYFHIEPGAEVRVRLRRIDHRPLAGSVQAINSSRSVAIETVATFDGHPSYEQKLPCESLAVAEEKKSWTV